MRSVKITGTILAFVLLSFGTVMIFQAFDRHSHSASDTLRPFVITMFPVWLIAIAGAWALLRSSTPAQHR
jgi:lipopolysaccharide export LptBFGC system permease protein LptF